MHRRNAPKHRYTRKDSCIIENVPENLDRRLTLNVEQIRANCSHELQQELPSKLGLRTDNSVSNTVQHPGHQTGTQARIEKKDANEDLTDELQKQIAEIHQAAKDNLMQSYLKYKRYYNKNASNAIEGQ